MDASTLPDFHILPYLKAREPLPSNYEKDVLSSTLDESLTLNATSSWTYCGPLLTLDQDHLPSSFHTWAEATVSGSLLTPLFSFLTFVHEFLETNNLAHYWLTVRATKGSNEYDIPRWHTDDLFFSPLAAAIPPHRRRSLRSPFRKSINISRQIHPTHQKRASKELASIFDTTAPTQTPTSPAQILTPNPTPTNWKLTTTLLGPGTLFIPQKTSPAARDIQRSTRLAVRKANPDHICLSVRCVGCASAAESVRTRLAAELEPHGVVQAQSGECVFFRVGEEKGAVHSEPRSHGDRIFVNVVPGDEGDLKCLMAKWGMEYPRAWCVGLPFQMAEEVLWRNVGEV
ncbi:hypothetical protein N7532_006862 [Penicillium argentinense]|uniref:Uncharacterized protein n=1 Tax=Penicillium argentinense TaxID=1131581 RepID=A0A9W9FGS2_9EURO|nr:uncharacterized protein N7532_006862 [Penicillium argentinense]KAJ5099861.1 hypothetical protein N7532_006862 [Penicillium argentinense]